MSMVSALTFADPSAIMNQLNIEMGCQVADFGCGSGFFSFELAQRVGSGGRVYALDILPSALESVRSRAKILNLSNIIIKRANLERQGGSGLDSQSMDWVVTKDILFQNKDKQVIIQEMTRILKPGGQAVLMEWNPQESLVGPDVSLRVSPNDLRQLVESAHLSVAKELQVGGFHYAFLVQK